MSVFIEYDLAEIEIEKIKLQALEDKLHKLRPLYEHLTVEIASIKDDILRMEKKLNKKDL